MFGRLKLAEIAEESAEKDLNGLLVQGLLEDKAIRDTVGSMTSESLEPSS